MYFPGRQRWSTNVPDAQWPMGSHRGRIMGHSVWGTQPPRSVRSGRQVPGVDCEERAVLN